MPEPKIAVIYARVSTSKQSTEANGLASQIHNCQEFADRKNLHVVATFSDDISGKEIERPGISELIAFLKAAPSGSCAVIVDDISRFSRNLFGHLLLSQQVEESGGVLMSPTGQFGRDHIGKYSEHIQAMSAEFFREQNAAQTRSRQRANVLQGRWLWGLPPGYKHAGEKNNKYIARVEPAASIMAQALEDFAYGILETQEEFRRALANNPRFPKGKSGTIHKQKVKAMLQNPLYAGYLQLPSWGIPLTKAVHEPLISLETYQRIQERLAGRAKAPARKDINEDFPLRGFVNCGCCGAPLRASWSKGRSRSYAYYVCQTKSCDHYGKSIKKSDIEGEFETLLHMIRPSEPILGVAGKLFKRLWEKQANDLKHRKTSIQMTLKQINREIDGLVERIINTSQPSLISAYERKISDLELRRSAAEEQLGSFDGKNRSDQTSFEETYRTALEFLSNPWILWSSDRIQDKKAVLKLAFTNPLIYDRNGGYRTMSLSLPFKVLESFSAPQNIQNLKMVRMEGLEPPRLSAPEPKSGASTNFATSARQTKRRNRIAAP